MKSFQTYKQHRTRQNPEFWNDYQERFETFKLGVLVKQAREDAGLTREDIAEQLHTSKAIVSRMENHAPGVKLATLEKFAMVVGKKNHVALD